MFAAITVKIGLGGLLLLPFWIAAIGWLSSRILGIHLGRWRAGIAAFLGWIVGLTAAALVVGGDTTVPDWIIIVLVIFFGVLAALPFAIVLDLITRSTGPPRRGRRRPIKAIHAAIAALLLERGADPDARQQGGFVPLHSAAARGDQVTGRLLLDHGATRDLRADDGRRPIDLAPAGDGIRALLGG